MKPKFYSLAFILSFVLFNIWQYSTIEKQDSNIKSLHYEASEFEDRISVLESIKFDINGETKFMIHENGGTSVGGDNSPPMNGLHVLGDVELSGNVSNTGPLMINSENAISFGVGSNNITIDSSGILINGIELSITGSASVDISSPQTSVSGSTILDLDGGVILIN